MEDSTLQVMRCIFQDARINSEQDVMAAALRVRNGLEYWRGKCHGMIQAGQVLGKIQVMKGEEFGIDSEDSFTVVSSE